MEYDKQLEEYGILAKNAQANIENKNLFIMFAEIDKIILNYEKLKADQIEKICISGSEIKYILFNNCTTIDLDFICCNFKSQVIARECKFNNTITFHQCIFETIVDFSKATFNCQTIFFNSIFKAEARFANTQFLAKQGDDEIIENNFRQSIFEGNAFFDSAVFQAKVSFVASQFKTKASFINTKFSAKQGNDEIIENDFRESIFEGNAPFGNVEFKARVSFGISRFKAEASFINIQFLAKQGNGEITENDFQETIFEGNTYFSNIAFQGRVSFIFSSFMGETLFIDTNTQNCIFNHTEFNKTKFIKVDYKNAETYTFRNSTFKDTLSFENTNISKLVFDNVVFKGIVTFNKTNFSNKPSFINCTFSNQFNIEHKYIQYSYEDIEKTRDYSQLLNYRDMFRKLKSNRIAHHNLIDTSELHSQELYARELELKHKETKTLKEKVEKWQLWFYHNLCDHHTDILKSFHSLMLVIGLFGLVSLGVIIGFDYYLGYKPIFSHLYMVKEIYDAHIQSFIKTHTLYTIACDFLILGFYLVILYFLIRVECLRRLFIGISYVVVIGILLISPKILIPAMGIFTDKKALLDPLSTLGGIYTICFGFVLFSFIKTIRKNSIVPN